MRDIKFKVWDTKAKCFIARGTMMDLYSSARANCFIFDNDSYDLDDGLLFLQYSGCKDKNGRYIFEGDIIKWVDHDYEERQDVIKWEAGGLCLCNNSFTIGHYLDKEKELEVIGNIYENPELVK